MHNFEGLKFRFKRLKEKDLKEIILNLNSSGLSIAYQSKDLSLTSSNNCENQRGKTYIIRIERLILEIER